MGVSTTHHPYENAVSDGEASAMNDRPAAQTEAPITEDLSEDSEETLNLILAATPSSEAAAEQLLEAVKHSELTAEQLLQAIKSRQVVHSATDGMLGPNPFVGLSRKDMGATVKMIAREALTKSKLTLSHLVNFAREEFNILKGESELTPDKDDNRFADPTWTENPLYRRGLQTYLAVRNGLNEWIADTGLNRADAERARFILSLATEALAPSNWLTNPAALKRFLETGGANAVRGIGNLIHDIRYNNAMPSMANRRAFTVGKDLANTPGAVVFRSEVCELLQYTPRTERVHTRPFLFVPPQINKFYLYDLSSNKSLIRYALDHGLQVFAISWRNPTPAQRDWGLDTYVAAVEEAIDVLCDITGSPNCNILGGCAGGMTTTALLGYLAARGEHKVNALALMVTMFDMSVESQLGLFATEEALDEARAHSARKGVLDGGEMARVFAWMRPNDLIWNYWVNNYLLGNDPPAFDVLAWNADTTRLPARFHGDLLNIIKHNAYMQPGLLKVRGLPLDVSQIDCDVFWMAGTTDHITPWPACYQSSRLISGRCEFVLSTGGHIQSMLSAPGGRKAEFYTNPERPEDPEQWLAGATRHEGSWWRHWRTWILRRSGPLKEAPPDLGHADYPPIVAAPGTYLFE